jgi:hypothetical protein
MSEFFQVVTDSLEILYVAQNFKSGISRTVRLSVGEATGESQMTLCTPRSLMLTHSTNRPNDILLILLRYYSSHTGNTILKYSAEFEKH